MHACLWGDDSGYYSEQLDEVVVSATVLFSSPRSGENVEKHFQNLQTLLTAATQPAIDD